MFLEAVDPEENDQQITESSINLSTIDSLQDSQVGDADNSKKEDLSNIGLEDEVDIKGLLENSTGSN